MRQKKAKNKKEKPAHTTQNGQTGNGCKSLRKSGNQTRRPGNDAAECGQRKAAEGRHDCGKPHAHPPGSGTSLHPGAASQTRQRKPRTHKRMAGKRQAAQARPSQTQKLQAAHKPGTRRRHTGKKNAGAPGAKVLTTAAGFAKTAAPAGGAAHWTQKKPLRTAKFAFALLPARRGHVNQDRQKTLRCFGWHGLLLLRIAHSAAQRRTKGGAAPFYPLQAF